MKWFDQWFYSKVRWAWLRAQYQFPELKQEEDYLDSLINENLSDRLHELGSGTESDPHDLTDGMRIDVKKSMGGYIVTVRTPCDSQQQKTSSFMDMEHSRTTYIITDESDFDQELCKILSMERLKR